MLFRPEAIRRSGHGDSSLGEKVPDFSKPRYGESIFHGHESRILFIPGLTPSASATPMHWFSVPAIPSVIIQHVIFFARVIM
jgi:hypothetical protein